MVHVGHSVHDSVAWIGPVLAPLILSITMILLSSGILYFSKRMAILPSSVKEWTLLIVGSVLVVFSFTWDYNRFIFSRYYLVELLKLSADKKLFETQFELRS